MSSRKPTLGSPRSKGDTMTEALTKELSLLNKQKDAAIAACDFTKARAIDCHLDRLKEELTFTKVNANLVESQSVLDLKKEALRVKAAALTQRARDAVFAAQSAHQDRLIALYDAHSRELQRFADKYADAVELEIMRIVPEAIHLKQQAQFSAKNRDYGMADLLIEQSNETQKQQLEKKRTEVKQLFEGKKERIDARHRQEIQNSRDKQDRDIEAIQQKFNGEIARYRNSLMKTALDVGISLTEADTAFLGEFRLMDPARSPSLSPKTSGSVSPGSPSRHTPPPSPNPG